MESMRTTPTATFGDDPPPPDFTTPAPPPDPVNTPEPPPADWTPVPSEGEVRTDRESGASYAYHDGKWEAVQLATFDAAELEAVAGDEPGSREHIGYATVRDQAGRQVVVATFGPAE